MKASRQRRIAELLRTRRIGSQSVLAEALLGDGERVTQATLSRDLEELGAIKVRDGDAMIYRVPDSPPDPLGHLQRMLVEFAHEITASANLVVVRTPPGCAQPVARALDTADLDGVLATVAGDDTILVISADPAGGDELCTALRSLADHKELA